VSDGPAAAAGRAGAPEEEAAAAEEAEAAVGAEEEAAAEEAEAEEAEAAAGEEQASLLREELGGMKPSALKKRAKEVGVEESKLDEADDADDVKATLIELIVGKVREGQQQEAMDVEA